MTLVTRVTLMCHASHIFKWRLTWNEKSRDDDILSYYCLMSQNEVQKILCKLDKYFYTKCQSSTVRSGTLNSVASRESQPKKWNISCKNDFKSKLYVYQCVWSIHWLKYVKKTGLQNKVFKYLTLTSWNCV